MAPSTRRWFPWAVAATTLLAAAGWAGAQQATPVTGKRSVTGPAGALYVDDAGGVDGIPVLFLHSFAGDSSHWASQLSHMRHHRRAVAMDLRGHGKSARPKRGDYAVEAMAQDVAAVADALKLERFVLVGHGMGGAVAAAYAARNPKRVAGLVLVAAPGKLPPEQAREIAASLESDYENGMARYRDRLLAGAQPHVATEVTKQMREMPKEDALEIVRALSADDPLAAIDRYKGPKLVVYTDGADAPHELHNVRPDLPAKHLPGTSHWPHMDRPKEFAQVLEEFLSGVR